MKKRDIAIRIILWRKDPSPAFLTGIPLRILADPHWREKHLMEPAIRIARRKAPL